MRYRLIGVDLDGTLLNSQGQISPRNLSALAAAQQAGAIVAPCTGRAWIESRKALEPFPNPGLGVFVTGAAVSDLGTGRTLDISVIEPHLALRIVELLDQLPEAVLLFRDAAMVGHDYLVTGAGTLDANTRWWFDMTGATVHFQRRVRAEDLHHTMRAGLVAEPQRMGQVAALLRDLGDQVSVQSFQAVNVPEPERALHVLEIFAAGVDKWRGLEWIAEQHGIQPEQIAVIGDEINDLAMFTQAGCPIAMGNAIDPLKSAARYITTDHNDHGVAYALEQLVGGAWE